MSAQSYGVRAPLLVIGAHAFDAEVMAGALVAEWTRQGGRGVLVHVSLGERGHHSKSSADYAAQKRGEALEAARLLGAETCFLDQPDTDPTGADRVADEIAGIVRSVRPGYVVTHWRGSWHPDHVGAHSATMRGLLLAGLAATTDTGVAHAPRLLLFGENWEDGEDFQPDTYLDVTPSYETWLQALNAYEIGRIPAPGFPYQDYYASLARMRGCVVGTRYAEAFQSAPIATMAGLGLGVRDRWETDGGAVEP
jgi:LmbE family N-acetylglucosaminyl deacetylase